MATFLIIELIYIIIRAIPKSEKVILKEFNNSEPFLLVLSSLREFPNSVFYINNIFSGYKTFKKGYNYLENHFLL